MSTTFLSSSNKYLYQQLAILFVITFLVRALTFQFIVAPHEWYKQPDSGDYHLCALGMSQGSGMHRIDTNRPLFWRTPGYPAYLAPFYAWYHDQGFKFSDQKQAQQASIWVQIFLTSFIPLIAFFLVVMLCSNLWIAWIVAYICALHPGLILASTYLLTDALALLLFLSFLYFFYKSFSYLGDKHNYDVTTMLINIALAAVFLGLYTWFRPIGRYIAVASVIIMLLARCSWQEKFIKGALFMGILGAVISPWYIRNYNITGHYFFCPMSGPYLQTFIAPKIMRRLTDKPLAECMQTIIKTMQIKYREDFTVYKAMHPQLFLPHELTCAEIARPWVINHPFYFGLEWMIEVIKTTFDLYAAQLVSFANNTFYYDPPEEFLTEKWKLALFTQPMPLTMRIIAWIEAIFMFLQWIGLLAGAYLFLLTPCIKLLRNQQLSHDEQWMMSLWLKAGLMIGALLIMTGGFGYARLRMPIEPLLWMLSLTWWYTYYKQHNK